MMCSNRAANSSSSRTIFVFFFCGCFCRPNRGDGGGIVVVLTIIIAFFFFSSLKSSLSSSSSFGRDRKDISLKPIIFYRRERAVFLCALLPSFSDEKFVRWPISALHSLFVLVRGPSSQSVVVNERKDFFFGRTRGNFFRRRRFFFSPAAAGLSFTLLTLFPVFVA